MPSAHPLKASFEETTELDAEHMTTELDIEQIIRLIPHRAPMLMVDRLIDVVPYESAVGVKKVSIDDWYFQGHFPRKAVMPGVMIIEALAQTAATLAMHSLGL